MQAVILAAGEGRRVRPLTWSRPKAMIPVANQPIIAYTIDALVTNGIRDIIVVVGYRKEHVTRFLNQLDLPIDVVVQEKQTRNRPCAPTGSMQDKRGFPVATRG